MDQLLSDILKMDKSTLCSYLFFEFTSNEEFKLWSNGLKRVLLDHNIERMEYLLNTHTCNVADIKCRACQNPLYYLPVDDTVDEIRWMCLHCRGHEILRCKADEVVNALIKVTQTVSPQLVALTLSIILNNFNRYNSLSQPSVPDNPIDILLLMYERSKEDAFKLGGTNVVIVADIFKSSQSKHLLPVLYLADTVNIPTRYYLHALKSEIARAQIVDGSTAEPATEAQILELVNELMAIANKVIKSNSYLLLGPTLQSLIPPKYYSDKLYKFNLRAIVPLTELKLFETTAATTGNIDDGLEKIVNPALAICSIVNTLLMRKIGKNGTSIEERYCLTQKYLNTAIWMRMFVGTPFESLLYHIINDEEATVQ